MGYANSVFNHFRAVERWAKTTGGRATLDAVTFQLEVKHRNRYFHLLPQFTAIVDGRSAYVPSLVEGAFGFAGWLPYRPYSSQLAADKLAFKAFLVSAGLRTPAMWARAADAEDDFVLKCSRGSFGVQVAGPFRADQRDVAEEGVAGQGGGVVFAERFIQGRILKAWFWGSRPFFAHSQPYATITGDGHTLPGELARRRAMVEASAWNDSADAHMVKSCMAFQGLDQNLALPERVAAWVDFRYGRATPRSPDTPLSDNALDALGAQTRDDIFEAGRVVGAKLRESLSAPVLYAVDGIVDDSDTVWWLEMNSNPVLPPDGYQEIFADLFG